MHKLEKAFDKVNESPDGEICEPLKGLIKETNNLIERSADPEVLDAGLITSIQHIKHYEIAGYGAACTYAESLGYDEVKEQDDGRRTAQISHQRIFKTMLQELG